MEKINIAELLKDCPNGMELDCTMFDDVVFNTVDFGKTIIVTRTNGTDIHLNKYGTFSNKKDAKCVIFPKGKTTWEGFHRPFKDGDVVSVTRHPEGTWIGIFKQYKKTSFEAHCFLNTIGEFNDIGFKNHSLKGVYLATEEEKQKLFQAIKANGYKWNAETKTLEKLIQPKFKVGDKVRVKNGVSEHRIIDGVFDTFYSLQRLGKIDFTDQDNWELVPNEFDITTLKPFDKVLVRDNNEQQWTADMFSFYSEEHIYPYICVGHYVNQCIPYDQNKHLLGTTNDCDEYFKTWK